MKSKGDSRVSRPEGQWDIDEELLKVGNEISDKLNALPNFDQVLVLLLNFLVDGARRNGVGKMELQKLLVNTWDGIEWHEKGGG